MCIIQTLKDNEQVQMDVRKHVKCAGEFRFLERIWCRLIAKRMLSSRVKALLIIEKLASISMKVWTKHYFISLNSL